MADPSCNPSYRDGWYRFTTSPTTISISIEGTSNRRMGYALYSGTCGSLTEVNCNVPSNVRDLDWINVPVSPNTTYYLRVIRSNNDNNNDMEGGICVSHQTTSSPHCTPISTNTIDYISNFSTSGGSTNISNLNSGFSTGGYGDFYATHTATQFAGGSLNFTETYVGGNQGFSIWVDLNNNGVFETSERLYNAGTTANGFTGTITIPFGTPIGDYRMRIRAWWNNVNPDPCSSITYGEAEDYKLTVTATPPCAAQPTAIAATLVTPTTARLNWTAASPVPASGYDYYYSTNPAPPTSGTTPSGSVGSTVLFADINSLTPNTTYYYWVRSNCNATEKSSWNGPRTFTTPPTPPANDLCSNATLLDCGTTNLNGTTVGSTNSASPVACGSNYGVWYRFDGNGQQTTISATADFDHELSILSGNNSCGAFVDLACIDGPGAGGTESFTFITSPGVTYYVYISHFSSSSTVTGTFTISRTCVPVVIPPNDLCGDAIELSCGDSFNGTTDFSTITVDNTGCNTSSYGVWYEFEGDGDSSTITAVPESGYNLEMSIASGNCGTFPDTIACVNNNGAGGTETYTFNTTLGVQYYIYIAHNNPSSTQTGDFTISRSCAPPTHCTPTTSSDTSYYINNFTTTGGTTNINHTNSGFSAGGYGNFSAMNVTQIPGGTINFNATHIGGTFETNIWVDWNDDFDFDDANELVFNSTGYLATQTGNFSVPITASVGPHRMRVRSAWFNSNPPPCGYIDRSETHDYTLIVAALNCTSNPIDIIATATSTTTANISWTAANPAPGIGYDYLVSTNPNGTPVVASGTVAGTSASITGLTPGTTYYVFVRGRCNASDQGVWVSTTLSTSCSNIVQTPTTCPLIVDSEGNDPFTTLPFIADPTAEIDCDMASVTLVANANLRQTTSYIVEQIQYPSPAPEYNFSTFGGAAQVITSDDVWAATRTNLNFNFCFYGEQFNQTLVGANGMITFDTANIPGTNCGWEFYNNLPSTAVGLFEKTIYGVYHDIDPRNMLGTPIKSRTVGTPGCRQFQVSWNDIPMYGDPTRLYTGMIVLHETTNIIEVFIKEKRIENGNVNPWNGGNALVGIQGDVTPLVPNGNQYLAAPCRNSLDTNWETTNEAWRFTPNGSVINPTSVTWYAGSVAPANVITSNPNNSVTVNAANTYFASVTYNICGQSVTLVDEIVVTDPRKQWNGSTNNNWYVDTNWTPVGVPQASDCVVIPDISPNTNYPIADVSNRPIPLPPAIAAARNVSVRNNASLTINPNTFLEITEWLNVDANADVLIRDSGSLVQIDESHPVNSNNNTGSIRMQRTVPGGVANNNYVYWSSPVEAFNVNDINTAASELRWEWNPTIDGIHNGTWVPTSGAMTVGKGYIVRGLAAPPLPIPVNTAEFDGRPSNGIITTPITRGTYTNTLPYMAVGGGDTEATNIDDNWNLVGNPYPSAISGSAFITTNATGGNPTIDGTIYLWSHLGTPSDLEADPFYGDYAYNYLGSDYVAYNGVGPNPPLFNGNIASWPSVLCSNVRCTRS